MSMRIKYTDTPFPCAHLYNEQDDVVIPEEKFFFAHDSSINFHVDASRILFTLSSLEFKLLYYAISTMDNNFQIKTNRVWKSNFKDYLVEYGGDTSNSSVQDATLNKITSILCKKTAFIKYPGKRSMFFVNPLFFSRNDLDRRNALKVLLDSALLPRKRSATTKKMPSKFDRGDLEKKKNFTLSSFELKSDISKLKAEEFEKALNSGFE